MPAGTLYSQSNHTIAIWNTNAFFAYIISVKIFHLQWETRRLLAVILATLGVLVVVYGGTTSKPSDEHSAATLIPRPTAPLIGDLLTLLASVLYALYQVMYKKYAALPSDPELASEGMYEPLPASGEDSETVSVKDEDGAQPPPFGFHPNFLTSVIGICTMLVLWIPLPLLHYLEIETFALPTRWATASGIVAIALSGVVFNAGFMVSRGCYARMRTLYLTLL